MTRSPLQRLRFWAMWFAFACASIALGVVVGFYIWAPGVVERFNGVVANQQDNTIFYDAEGGVLATLDGLEDRHTIPLDRMSVYIQKAVVGIEDRRFFAHRGMDPIRLLAAIWADLQAMAFQQGASTITQQLVKLTLLSAERTLTRKVKEIFMALALEREYSKDQILTFYLNQVYLGRGVYGVEKASRAYFDKPSSDLTLAEAAWLAALVKKPEGFLLDAEIVGEDEEDQARMVFPPSSDVMVRQRQVLTTLAELGWITRDEYFDARSDVLDIRRPVEEVPQAPYFVQQAVKEMRELLDIGRISGRGYRVYTTLDPEMQAAAEAEVTRFAEDTPEGRQAAMVALDPRNGEVRALVGGTDFRDSEFNRATQAMRQPGSAFKPILYAAALEEGYTPQTVFRDEPVRYVNEKADGEVEVYEPRNYGEKYGVVQDDGHAVLPLDPRMTLGRALIVSSNVIAVQLLDRVGVLPVRRLGRRLGIDVRPRMGLCIALGCSEVTLLQLTSAYGSFANGGQRVRPVFIRKITDSKGRTEYEHYAGLPEQAISSWTAFQINHLLQGVVRRGTGYRARLDRPVGGKTGTNDGPRDTWFVGFTPTLVAGVWSGHDDNSVMPFESGGRSTAMAWRGFMDTVLPPYDGEAFPEPETDYVAVRTCTVSGEAAGEWCPHSEVYYYRADDPAREVCSVHVGPPVAHATCVDSGELISPHCPNASRQYRYFYANSMPSRLCPVHMPGGWIFGDEQDAPRTEYIAPPQAGVGGGDAAAGRRLSEYAQRLERAFSSSSGQGRSLSN